MNSSKASELTRRLRYTFVTALLVFLPVAAQAQAQDARQQRINSAIDAAERICLVGNRYKFSVDALGKLTISKLLPGVDVKVTVDSAQAKGSQFFDNEEVRRLVDQDIRDCMKTQWTAVLQVMGSLAQDTIEVRAAKVCAGIAKEGGNFQGSFKVDDLTVIGDVNGTVSVTKEGVNLGGFAKGTYAEYNSCLIKVIELISPRIELISPKPEITTTVEYTVCIASQSTSKSCPPDTSVLLPVCDAEISDWVKKECKKYVLDLISPSEENVPPGTQLAIGCRPRVFKVKCSH